MMHPEHFLGFQGDTVYDQEFPSQWKYLTNFERRALRHIPFPLLTFLIIHMPTIQRAIQRSSRFFFEGE